MGIIPGRYDVELIKRTRLLIDTYDGRYNLTLLMNSLLSLIVLPQQHNVRVRRLNFMNRDLNHIEELHFIQDSANFVFDPRNNNPDLKNLMTRIRNGIAHQRIESISEQNVWKGIIIEDYDRNNNLGLHLELSIEELRQLVFYIVDNYLNEVGEIEYIPQYDY